MALLASVRALSNLQMRWEVWRVVWDRIWIKPALGYGFFTYWETAASMSRG
ncbi:MAG: hypothetical protein R2716_12760 [Microthrixaceae bacterium]